MIRKTDELVKKLLLSEVSVADIEKAQDLLKTKELYQILSSPTVTVSEKKKVVEEIFPASVCAVISELAVDCELDIMEELKEAYIAEADRKNRVARAKLFCVTEPDEKQLEGIRDFVAKEEDAGSAEIEIIKDESLLGGFIIEVGNKQFDRSLRSKIKSIKEKIVEEAKKTREENTAEIISILRSEVKDYDFEVSDEEIGTVVSVGDGIASIH